ncbi:MAG: transcriptional regulator [Sphingomonas sp. SCN 67-18]|uniref:MarR family winged helix-turn-helix transcriptional regulator n=1 Tax=uncultured Sphingomonas sp. TaxID=158754 RepID=UPI000869A0DB|nr:MarR family transcriptional regulator [Sphingomonas sp. SCN 67-18]ODU19619.1 MAG: transcriptional regulator [Sphingomonas sp. SCN 67-18]
MADPLGFLIADISRLMRRRFDERARVLGVTRPQWRLMLALSRNEGANQGTLAELIDVEPITLCRMVDRLQESGLVERRADPADRRAWRIYLTDEARPLLDELRAVGADLFEIAMAGLNPAERDALSASLERVRDNLDQRTPSPQKAQANG